MADYKVAIDAGHGGSDSGAVFNGRQEKNDVLRLAMAVGGILEKSGVDVFYVRDDDIYETPFKKATDANNSGADLFVSLHRNSSERPNQYSGVETLVFANGGTRTRLANNINSELEAAGFKNLGIDERPNLVVLKRTKMPAALVEVGFINNENDNKTFDENFNAIAQGIADGILTTLYQNAETASSNVEGNVQETVAGFPEDSDFSGRNLPEGNYTRWDYEDDENMNNNMNGNMNNNVERLYRVQVGAFRNKESADRMLNSLLIEGFPAFIVYDDGIYKVQVGAFRFLANAIKMEERLRRFRYNTYITT